MPATSNLKRQGMPVALGALQHHDCLIARENDTIGADRFDVWNLQHNGGLTARVLIKGPLASNSGELARDCCLARKGILCCAACGTLPSA